MDLCFAICSHALLTIGTPCCVNCRRPGPCAQMAPACRSLVLNRATPQYRCAPTMLCPRGQQPVASRKLWCVRLHPKQTSRACIVRTPCTNTAAPLQFQARTQGNAPRGELRSCVERNVLLASCHSGTVSHKSSMRNGGVLCAMLRSSLHKVPGRRRPPSRCVRGLDP